MSLDRSARMRPEPDEADTRIHLREMSVAELVDSWEEPMLDAVRALLLAELEDRNYRVKSLPGPPTPDAAPSEAATLTQGVLSGAERSVRRVERGVMLILLIAVLQLLFGGYAGFVQAGAYSQQLEELSGLDESQTTVVDGETFPVGKARVVLIVSMVLAIGVQLGLGSAFFALFFWARTRPRPALWLALMLYLGLQGVQVVVDPSALSPGIVLKGLIAMGLMFGIVGAGKVVQESSPDAELEL